MSKFNVYVAEALAVRNRERNLDFKPRMGTFVEDATSSILTGLTDNVLNSLTIEGSIESLNTELNERATGVSDSNGGFLNKVTYPGITGEYVDAVSSRYISLFDFVRNTLLKEISTVSSIVIDRFGELSTVSPEGTVHQAVKLEIVPDNAVTQYEESELLHVTLEGKELGYMPDLPIDKLKDPSGAIATEYFGGDSDRLTRVRSALMKYNSSLKISLEERQEVMAFYQDMHSNPGVNTGLGYYENEAVAAQAFNNHRVDQEEHIESIRSRRELGYLTDEPVHIDGIEIIDYRNVDKIPTITIPQNTVDGLKSKLDVSLEEINSFVSHLAETGKINQDIRVEDIDETSFRNAVSAWEENSAIYSPAERSNQELAIKHLVVDVVKELYGETNFANHEGYEFIYIDRFLESISDKSFSIPSIAEALVQLIICREIYSDIEGLYEIVNFINIEINNNQKSIQEAFASAVVLVVNDFIIKQIQSVYAYGE